MGVSSSRRGPEGTADAVCGATSCFQIALSFVFRHLGVCIYLCVYANIRISQWFFWKAAQKLLYWGTENDKDLR